MRRMNLLLVLIVISVLPLSAGNPLRPRWIGNPPSAGKNYYFVIAHNDASSSLDGARASSLRDLTAGVERTDAVRVKELYTDNSTQTFSGGKIAYGGQDSYNLELEVVGEAVPIKSRRVDEYWKTVRRGGIPVLEYTALYAVERKGTAADFSGISVTSSYGFNTMWRSFVIPGWGQLYKGDMLKGGAMIGGTAALVAGIIITENTRSDYVRFMHNTHDANLIRSYQSQANHFTTARNICIGSLVALYVWNVVDALVAPGARYVTVSTSGLGFTKNF